MSLRTQLEKGFTEVGKDISRLDKAVRRIRNTVTAIIVVLIISLIWAISTGAVDVKLLQ